MDTLEGTHRELVAGLRQVAVVGIGHSKFGRRTDVNLGELAFESIKQAVEDAGVEKKQIENVTVGSAGGWYEESLPAVIVNEYAGFEKVGTMRVEAACASGSAAVRYAYLSIASGEAEIAMAVGLEKMTEVDTLTSVELMGRAGSYLWEFENYGMTFPAYYALYAVAHMKRFGTTEEDMARVAVKAHHYASMNPLAQFQKEITLEKALSSQVVSWPLKLYDACPITDGSAAVVLASEDVARKLSDTPVWIKGHRRLVGLGEPQQEGRLRGPRGDGRRVARRPTRAPRSRPADLDVATCHDCFTIAELMAYEDLGFCAKGEGPKLLREGQTEIGGRIPVNVDGGLKAKGHPVGATGVSMMVEVSKQLRGEAGKRPGPHQEGERPRPQRGRHGALLLRHRALEGPTMMDSEPPTLHSRRTLSLRFNLPISKTHQFWDSLREGKFVTTKCRDCGEVSFPPQSDCPRCMSGTSSGSTWGPTPNCVTFTYVQVTPTSFVENDPYLVAIGRLGHGLKILAWIEGDNRREAEPRDEAEARVPEEPTTARPTTSSSPRPRTPRGPSGLPRRSS